MILSHKFRNFAEAFKKHTIMAITFKLRSTRNDKKIPVWVRVREVKNNVSIDVSVPTDVYLYVSEFDTKSQLPKGNTDELKAKQARLVELRNSIETAKENFIRAGRTMTKANLETIINTHKAVETIPTDILSYLDYLIEKMKSGDFRFKGDEYDKDTIKVWVTFRSIWERFSNEYETKTGNIITWDNIDKQVIDMLIKSMEDYGYLTKTINKYLITFKSMVRYSSDHHNLHNNLKCLSLVSKKTEKEGCSTTKTYLNDAEVQALYEMELPLRSHKDKVRDIFLVGVYTCQRVSDYNNLTRANFSTTSAGTKVIRLTQEKTDTTIVVPILNDNLERILEKYDYQLPKGISDVIINRYIKDICKELSKTTPSLNEYMGTILTLPEIRAEKAGRMTFERNEEGKVIKHRYECITTHTARRSGITNMYKSRMFSTLQMMSISGHKTESNFFAYISESADELADEIASIQKAMNDKKASNEDLF